MSNEEDKIRIPISNENYIKDLELHSNNCKEGGDYAIKRFDILIISLSSGAIAITSGFLKDMIEIQNNFKNLSIKVAIILFGCSIIVNLSSQITSYYANNLEMKITKNIIRKEKGKSSSLNQKKVEYWKSRLNNSTIFLNATSFFSFTIGSIFLLKFIFTNF